LPRTWTTPKEEQNAMTTRSIQLNGTRRKVLLKQTVSAAVESLPPVATSSFMQPETREILSCPACRLVQFRTRNSLCRRCHKPLDPPDPESMQPQPFLMASAPASMDDLSEAAKLLGARVRELRKESGMTQRDLARSMEVPRTYISKVERSKAIPTLASLDRIATALGVEARHLICDARSRRANEVIAIFRDEFLGEIACLADKLNPLQRALLLRAARDAAADTETAGAR
jgi:transcriptional regulator with XRE-family HTH domain